LAKKPDSNHIIDYGLDIANRRIYFGVYGAAKDEGESNGDVGWASVEMTIRNMHVLVAINNRPIEIHASSDGGCPAAMLRLIDEIESCSVQVKFVGGGLIASSMTWIMAVCDERHIHKNSSILVHDGSTGIGGTHTDVNIDMAETNKMQDKLNTMFADNSRMSKEFWEEILQRNVYLTADEALTLGLVDKIIQPKKRGNLRKSRIYQLNQEVDAKEMNSLVKSIYKRIGRKKLNNIKISIPDNDECDPEVVIEEIVEEENIKNGSHLQP
jgi:ATP-dependent Clp protease protease subunit